MLDSPSPDHRCWSCGAEQNAFRFDCPECARRWEELECRQLRERLFGRTEPEEHRVA